tara:strand:+ start:440 stop:568 length:129 start_codon:yes stop_codon:yes gene_type:complete
MLDAWGLKLVASSLSSILANGITRCNRIAVSPDQPTPEASVF